ncbi:MAG TPA: T9SS type A sorting domain-containing protein [Bacteroidales bacterium]|nr:T9SS type A sorting domain-containing protein [Bacteroidales bacterium]HRZ20256.1 T9SS type A sorting domain-containing protein [Bacteroidales bacterium]
MSQQLQRLIQFILVFIISTSAAAQLPPGKHFPRPVKGKEHLIDTRIDNMTYWKHMAEKGYVEVAPFKQVEPATYRGSRISSRSVTFEDSPDVRLTEINSTQSENSVFVNPNDNQNVLQSNNSTTNPVSVLYGANDFFTFDGGETWEGEVEGAGGENSGDPSVAISNDGRYYVGYIHSNYDQGVSYSTDQGQTWTAVQCAGGGYILDKNHLWIDNSPSSPYEGNLYSAWTNFQGGSNDSEIEIVRTTDGGVSYSSRLSISSAVSAGSHNQGVNIQTGPDGQVYVVWTIYDGWPTDETAMGFAKSLNGGVSYQTAHRIIENIRGIRTSETSKDMRVNSFPSMAVDISDGPNRGNIYVVWTNIGVPGTNTGPDIDIYMIRSTDEGETWSDPIRVNQDPSGLGNEHYFPWITCDREYGTLSVIFYDDRNVSNTQCEVFCAVSSDGGDTWEDFRVSDVAFTPAPVDGLAGGYMGDYLGISANDRMVYPVWSDNRLGYVMAFASPFQTGPPPNQPWVIYNAHQINDLQGNGNGLADFGESILIDLTMENIGDQPASSVSAVLTTDNPYVTLTDAEEDLGDFSVEEVKNLEGIFALTLDNSIPDEEKIDFLLTSTDANDSTFLSEFTITAHAPALKIGSMAISDPTGNNNGRLDPGETADIYILTSNPGDYTANNVMATLSSSSSEITLNITSADLGNMEAGEIIPAIFNVTVSENAFIGSAATLDYSVESEYHSAQFTFVQKIGLIVDDFETGDFSSFDWHFVGSSPWILTGTDVYEGSYSAVSGPIGNNSYSELRLEYEAMYDDTISFYRKVSSEVDYDYLSFYIDDVLQDQWSGEVDWGRVAFTVTPGSHWFSWSYSKDVYTIGGQDKAWIDFVVFPARLRTSASAGNDGISCETTPFALSGNATKYNSILWTTSGNGSFNDPTILAPVYTPGDEDVAAGSVTLTLTAYGDDITVSDAMTLAFSVNPTAFAGSDIASCDLEPIVLQEAVAEHYDSLLWTTTGMGTLVNATELQVEYMPVPEELGQSVTLTLTAYATEPCQDITDEMVITFIQTPDPQISGPLAVCQNAVATYSTPLLESYIYTWEIGGGTIQSDPNTNEITVLWDTTGTDNWLIATQTNGLTMCHTWQTVTIAVHELPVPSISGDVSVCENENGSLYSTAAMEGHSYLWAVEGGSITSGQDAAEISVDWGTAGTGTLSIVETIDSTGCQMNAGLQVAIHTLPVVSIGNDTSICHNHVLTLNAGNPGAQYLWSTGETSQSITIDTTGVGIGGTKNISVIVTDAEGCASEDARSVYFEDCTGIDENEYQLGVNLFPNPGKGVFTLVMDAHQPDVVDLFVLDSRGTKVYQQDNIRIGGTSQQTLDLTTLGEGIYFLNIQGEKAKLVKKLMIQK